jgi:hypothetical protein
VKRAIFPPTWCKLVSILRKSEYSGYLPMERLSPQGKPYDPFRAVAEFLAKLKDAIARGPRRG